LNRYVGVTFKGKQETENKEVFVVSRDLIKRGILGNLFIEIGDKFLQITDEVSILEWIKQSKNNKLYLFELGTFEEIGLNDIVFEDYIKIYSPKENRIGQFIVDKYFSHNEEECEFILNFKSSEFTNTVFCEYYNKTKQEFVYTERVLGLDRIIEDKQFKTEVKLYFDKIRKENL